MTVALIIVAAILVWIGGGCATAWGVGRLTTWSGKEDPPATMVPLLWPLLLPLLAPVYASMALFRHGRRRRWIEQNKQHSRIS